MLRPEDFFDLKDHPLAGVFSGCHYVWEALGHIKGFLKDTLAGNVADARRGEILLPRTIVLYDGKALEGGFVIDTSGKKPRVSMDGRLLPGASILYAGAILMDDDIYIGKDTVVEPGALIKGPTYIGNETEVRQGAYLRGDVLVGRDCVVGHTTEMKSSVMLEGSKAGHFAYIGDSILGKVNLGAGTKIANLKITGTPVTVEAGGNRYETGLRKFGAILADGVETGCNSVTTPGTLLSRGALLYPNCTARGYYPPGKIVKVIQVQDMLDYDFS
jgi:UDP-N-acetylglucosamine diphosphorylase / glucose-1-phosphate thymidylyltransferase / UDP-N-acetylgalactosamine diphosphorylase / glucosamine-1-phosphate N-acetyltransferase / galactosamine-1-phosphate N-acetyltransferase